MCSIGYIVKIQDLSQRAGMPSTSWVLGRPRTGRLVRLPRSGIFYILHMGQYKPLPRRSDIHKLL